MVKSTKNIVFLAVWLAGLCYAALANSSCTLSADSTTVPYGGKVTLTLRVTPSNSIPNGHHWYLTDIAVPQGNVIQNYADVGVLANGVGTTTLTNSQYLAGDQQLSAGVDPTYCTESNTITVTFIGPSCTLQTNMTDVPLGQTLTYTITGSNLPATAYYFWYGTHNGTTDLTNYPGGVIPPGVQNVLNQSDVDPALAGTYTRYAVVRSGSQSNSQILCTTNTTTNTFLTSSSGGTGPTAADVPIPLPLVAALGAACLGAIGLHSRKREKL